MGVLSVARYYRFRPIDLGIGTSVKESTGSEFHFSEYFEAFACRQFAVDSSHVLVAPYDMAFIEARSMNGPPPAHEVSEISFRDFEELWEQRIQSRLGILAAQEAVPFLNTNVLYVKMPFPESYKRDEQSSDLYTEWVNGVARRHFEVFPDQVFVATHDPEAGFPEYFEAVERAIETGVDDEGNPIDSALRPITISHQEFEVVWERHALRRLHHLAGLSS